VTVYAFTESNSSNGANRDADASVAFPSLFASFLPCRAQGKSPAYRDPVLEDVGHQSGLTVPHQSSPDKRYVIESMSGGSACLIATTTESRKAIEWPSALASPLDGVLQIDPGNDAARQKRIKVEALPN
jgi:hypothetical protein